MRDQPCLPSSPTIRPRVIRGVTVPNRAADCALFLRKSFSADGRMPSVPEIADALGVKQPAVVQFENVLRKRGVLRGSHRGGDLELASEILIPHSALVALVVSTLLHKGFDRQLGADVYTDVDKGPWDENTYTKIVQEKAALFGFEFENLDDIPELVQAGYLQGKPRCFRLNRRLWDRDKVIFIKAFQDLKPGKVGTEDEEDNEALFESLAKAATCASSVGKKGAVDLAGGSSKAGVRHTRVFILPHNYDVEWQLYSKTYKGLLEWIKCWQMAEAETETTVAKTRDLQSKNSVVELLKGLAKRAYGLFAQAEYERLSQFCNELAFSHNLRDSRIPYAIIPCFYNAYGFNIKTWRSTWLFGAFLLRLATADNPAGDHSVPHKPPTATSHLSVISPPNPVDNILMDMRLWTWQKQGFDLRDKKTEVKIFENSHFLNDTSIDEVKRNRHRNVYNKLCETLETDQFHWYSTIEDEAKHKESCRQWSDRNCVLWEVKVPVGSEVFRRVWKVRRVCSIAWVCLLKEFSIPTQLRSDWKRLSGNDKSLKKKYKQDFHDFWKGKSEKELWDALVLEKCVDGCTDILLLRQLHPNRNDRKTCPCHYTFHSAITPNLNFFTTYR